MAKVVTVKSEIARLSKIYKGLPPNQYKVVEGLIVEAARLRVLLDELWSDIEENGTTEEFQQSDKADPYLRERPAAKQFNAADKSYQAIIRQLNELTPASVHKSKLAGLLDD